MSGNKESSLEIGKNMSSDFDFAESADRFNHGTKDEIQMKKRKVSNANK